MPASPHGAADCASPIRVRGIRKIRFWPIETMYLEVMSKEQIKEIRPHRDVAA
jgi:hypothetical protein